MYIQTTRRSSLSSKGYVPLTNAPMSEAAYKFESIPSPYCLPRRLREQHTKQFFPAESERKYEQKHNEIVDDINPNIM